MDFCDLDGLDRLEEPEIRVDEMFPSGCNGDDGYEMYEAGLVDPTLDTVGQIADPGCGVDWEEAECDPDRTWTEAELDEICADMGRTADAMSILPHHDATTISEEESLSLAEEKDTASFENGLAHARWEDLVHSGESPFVSKEPEWESTTSWFDLVRPEETESIGYPIDDTDPISDIGRYGTVHGFPKYMDHSNQKMYAWVPVPYLTHLLVIKHVFTDIRDLVKGCQKLIAKVTEFTTK